MFKIIKLIVLVILCLCLCGCTTKDLEELELTTYCDKEYGIEYIRDRAMYRGGITVRLDGNGNVIHCGEEDE